MYRRSLSSLLALTIAAASALCSPSCTYGMPGAPRPGCHAHHGSEMGSVAVDTASQALPPTHERAPAGAADQCCCPTMLEPRKDSQPTKNAIRTEAMVAASLVAYTSVVSLAGTWRNTRSGIEESPCLISHVPLYLTQRSLLI